MVRSIKVPCFVHEELRVCPGCGVPAHPRSLLRLQEMDLVQASGPPHICLHSSAYKAFLPIFCLPNIHPARTKAGGPCPEALHSNETFFSLHIHSTFTLFFPLHYVNLFGLLLVVCMPVYYQDESLSYPHTHLWSVNVYTSTFSDKMKGRNRAAWKPEHLKLDGGIQVDSKV